MDQNLLEELVVRLVKDDKNLQAGLKEAERAAEKTASSIEKVWQDRFGKMGRNAGNVVKAASAAADASVRNTIRNLADQVQTLNAEFARGASNPQKYRAGLDAVARSLETLRSNTNLTVRENKQVEQALKAASDGYRRFEVAAVKAEEAIAAATAKRIREQEAAARAAALNSPTSAPGAGGIVNGMSAGSAAMLQALDKDARATSDRIARLGIEIRRVTEQFTAGRRSPEAYRAALNSLQGSLESMTRRAGLTQKDMLAIDTAMRQAAQGITRLDNSGAALDRLALKMGTTADKAQEVHASLQELRNLQAGYRSGVDATNQSLSEAVARQTQMRDAALKLASSLREGSTGWRQTMLVAEAAGRNLATLEGRVSRLGLSANVAAAQNRNLTQSLSGLQGIVGIAGIAGVGQLARQFREMALDSQTARISMEIFNREVIRSGQSIGVGMDVVGQLSDRFKLLREDVANNVTQLIRYGATLEQIEGLLTSAGASALARGRTPQEGFDAVTEALIGEMSQRLNNIGIAGNLGPAFQQYARDLGKSVEELTRAEKAQAALNMIMRETQGEIEAVDTMMDSFIGSNAELVNAVTNARRAVGQGLEPAMQGLFNAFAGGLNFVSGLPPSLLAGAAAAGVAGTAVVSLTGTIAALTWAFRALGVAAGPIGWITTGISLLVGAGVGIASATKEVDEFGDSVEELGASLTELDTLDDATKAVREFGDELSGSAKSALDTIIERMNTFGTSALDAARMWQEASSALRVLPDLDAAVQQANEEAQRTLNERGFELPGYDLVLRLETQGAEAVLNDLESIRMGRELANQALMQPRADFYDTDFPQRIRENEQVIANVNAAIEAVQTLLDAETELDSVMSSIEALAKKPVVDEDDGDGYTKTAKKLRTLNEVLAEYDDAVAAAGERAQLFVNSGLDPMQAELQALQGALDAAQGALNAMLTEELAGGVVSAETKQEFADLITFIQGRIDDLEFRLDPTAGTTAWVDRTTNLVERGLMRSGQAINQLQARLRELVAERNALMDAGIFNSDELDALNAKIGVLEGGLKGLQDRLAAMPEFPRPDEGQGGRNILPWADELQSVLDGVSQAEYELMVRSTALGEEVDYSAERIKILTNALMSAAQSGIPMTQEEIAALAEELRVLQDVAAANEAAANRLNATLQRVASNIRDAAAPILNSLQAYKDWREAITAIDREAALFGETIDTLNARAQAQRQYVLALAEEHGEEYYLVRQKREEYEALIKTIEQYNTATQAAATARGFLDAVTGPSLDVAGFGDFINRVRDAASGTETLREEFNRLASESPLLVAGLTAAARVAGFDLLGALDAIEASEAAETLAGLTDRVNSLASTASQWDEARADLIAFAEANEDAALAVQELLDKLDAAEAAENTKQLREAFEGVQDSIAGFLGTGKTHFDEMREAIDAARESMAELGYTTEEINAAYAALRIMEINAALREQAGIVGGLGGDLLNLAADMQQAIAVFAATGDTLGLVTDGFRLATQAVKAFQAAGKDGFDGNDVFSGLVGLASGTATLLGNEKLGKLIATAGAFVQSILGDMSNGVAQITKQIEDLAGSSRYLSEEVIRTFADANTSMESRGGLLGFLGFKKPVIDEIEVKRLTGIAESVASGLASAFNSSNLDEFRNAFNLGIDKVIQEQIINGFMAGPEVQAALANITMLLSEGDYAGARAAYGELLGDAEETWEILQKWNREMRNARGYAEEIRNAMRQTQDILANTASNRLERDFANGAIGLAEYNRRLQQQTRNNVMRDYQRQLDDLDAQIAQAIADGADAGFIAALRDQKKAIADSYRDALEQGAWEAAETIKQILGTSIQDVSNAVRSAFDAANISDFFDAVGNNLHDVVRNGLITAFLESAVFKPLLDALSDTITRAVMDGVLTPDEIQDITDAEDAIEGPLRWFLDVLDNLGYGLDNLNESVNDLTRNIPNVWKATQATFDSININQAITRPGTSPTNPGNGGTSIEVNINGPVYGVDDLDRHIRDTIYREEERKQLSINGRTY